MGHLGPSTLAAGWAELAVLIVVFGISALSALAKKAGKPQTPTTSGSRRPEVLGPSEGRTRLDEMAARRRAQLDTLARKDTGDPPAGQPHNLSMAQIQERAAAKLAYEERAQALRAQYARTQQAPPRPSSPTPPQPVRPKLPLPARPARRPPAARPAPAPPLAQMPKVTPARTDAADQAAAAAGRDEPTTQVTRLGRVDQRQAVLRLGGKMLKLTPGVMRSAVVLQEVLGPPVGLR